MKTMINKQQRKQRAMEYIIYMMVGSYFKSAKCTSKVLERRLFLQYKELGEKAQVDLESRCINYIERCLMKEVPAAIWDENVAVSMRPDAETGKMVVSFTGRQWNLSMTCDSLAGTHFEYEFKQNKPKPAPSKKSQKLECAA